MTDHKATPEQWQDVEWWSRRSGQAACVAELRARVEALEANSSAGLASSNHPEKPDSSLVERVARAISGIGPKDAINWEPEARAAIREVAAWLREQKAVDLPDHTQWAAARAAAVLEQEAER